jgi:hypothetical protein
VIAHCTFVLAHNTISYKANKNKDRKYHPFPKDKVKNYFVRSRNLAALGMGDNGCYYSQWLITTGERDTSFSPEPFNK